MNVPPLSGGEFFTINFSATSPVSFCADIYSGQASNPYSICEEQYFGRPYFDFQNETSGSECVEITATTFYISAIAYSLPVYDAANVTYSITESGGACGQLSSISFYREQSFLLESQNEVNYEVVPILLPSGYVSFSVNETTSQNVYASWFISDSNPGPTNVAGTSFNFTGQYSGVTTLELQYYYQVPEVVLASIRVWVST